MNLEPPTFRTAMAGFILAVFCTACLHTWCHAEEHSCADYPHFRGVLDEGRAESEHVSSSGRRSPRPGSLDDWNMYPRHASDVVPSEKEVARIQVKGPLDIGLALEAADRCVRFERPGLAIPLMTSALSYAVANVRDWATVAYVAESLASIIVLDAVGDQSLISDETVKPAPSHKSLVNSSLDLLASKVESRRTLKSLVTPQQLLRLQTAKGFFVQALEARKKAVWRYGSELIYLNLACLASLNGDKLSSRDHINDALVVVSDPSLKPTHAELNLIWSPVIEPESFDDTAACMLLKASIKAGDFDDCKKIEALLMDSMVLNSGSSNFRYELVPVVDTYATYNRGEDALRVLSGVPGAISIPTTTLAKVVLVLPENLKAKLFETHPRTFGDSRPVEKALAARGWSKDADNWMLKSVLRTADDQAETRQLSLARFYLKRKEFKQSRAIYQDVLGRLSKLISGNASSVRTCIRSSDSILSDLSESTVTWPDIRLSAQEISNEANKRLGVLQCLHLASELSKTGWKLEAGGKKESALKMYSSAFEISTRNLGPKDQVTIAHQLDVARVEGSLGNVQGAEKQYESALAILRKQKTSSTDTLKAALQNYADLLRRTEQHEKADVIYAELRRIDSKKPSSPDSPSKKASKTRPQVLISVHVFKGSKVDDRVTRFFYEMDNHNPELKAWLDWQRVLEKELESGLQRSKPPNVVQSDLQGSRSPKDVHCHISFVVGRGRCVNNIKVIEGEANSIWTRRAERAIQNASKKPFLEFPQETQAMSRPLVARIDFVQGSRSAL